MKRNYLLTMLITVLFMLPVMLVCQVPDITISAKAGKHTPIGPTDNALLYGQLSSPSDEPAVASQDFTDSTAYSCQAADDFIVPASETWLIDEVFISGQYSPDGGPASLAHLFIYLHDTLTDAPGVLVAELIDFPVTASPDGDLTFDIQQAPDIDPITLEQGHYWISVQPHMPYTPYKQWYWKKQENGPPNDDYPLHWRNPDGGFGLPYPDWTASTVVFEGTLDHRLTFGIYGEKMGCPVVVAGDDATIAEGEDYYLSDATAANFSSILWATNGDGTFDDATMLNPVYTPGAGDIDNGSVELCVWGDPHEHCNASVTDCMTLTIAKQSIIYKGLTHTSLGSATLELIEPDMLVVDNIGSSGEDGFSVDVSEYPDLVEWGMEADLDLGQLPVGASLNVTSKGTVSGVENQTISFASYEKAVNGFNAFVDFTSIEASSMVAIFYIDGTVVGEEIIPSGSIEFSSGVSGRVNIITVTRRDYELFWGTVNLTDAPDVSIDCGALTDWLFSLKNFNISADAVKFIAYQDYNPDFYYTQIQVTAANFTPLSIMDEYVIKGPPIPIPADWSIISSYLEPFNSSMEYLFTELVSEGKLEVMLGTAGIFWPSGSINTIGNWDVYQGYKVKMNAPGWIELTGEIPEDKTIHLNAGANYIPVLSQEFYPAMDIFTQLGDGLIFAFDLNTGLLWWPQGGIYTLEVLEPGKGYLVGMTQPGQATYNPMKANVKNHKPARPKVYENAPWSITKSGSTHFISINRSALGELEFGDFIGVFNNEGVCVGFIQIDEAAGNILLVAYGNDFTEKANTGLADSENMTFRIFHTSTGAETSASVSFDASMPNAGFYAENGLSMIVNIKTGATSLAENDLNKIHIYPNPSNGTFTIEDMHEKINVRIFNAFGGEVYLDELNLPAKVNLSAQPKGIYFISIETGNSTFYKKLVIH